MNCENRGGKSRRGTTSYGPTVGCGKKKCFRRTAAAVLLLLSMLVTSIAGCTSGRPSDNTTDGMKTTALRDADEEPDTDDGTTDYRTGYKKGMTLPDEMPVLRIDTDGGAAVSSKTEYVSGSASLDEPTGRFCFSERGLSLRCRGNWTYWGTGYAKKSYRLKFDSKVNLLGIERGASKNWVLLANFADRSLVRTAAAFAAAGVASGIGYVPSSAWVRLILNGRDLGVYQLCGQTQIGKWRIDISDDPETVDSDYLIELDSRARLSEWTGGNCFEAGGRRFVIKNDAFHPDSAAFLKEYFGRVFAALGGGNEEEICALIDIDSFTDMYLLQEFVKNLDVGWSSFYLVKKAGGKLYLTCPWDMDLTFGNYGAYGGDSPDGLFVGNPDYAGTDNANPLFSALCGCDFFVNEKVPERFALIGGQMRDAAVAEIERLYAAYADEFEDNFRIWQVLGSRVDPCPPAVWSIDSVGGNVGFLVDFINRRYGYLAEYFALPEKPSDGFADAPVRSVLPYDSCKKTAV